jgi:ADP-ribosylglycohydrolase
MIRSAIVGSILGTAVGDALGLPYEGLSRRRGLRLFGEPNRYHLFLGGGMVSDDTEHTCMAAQALIASGGQDKEFARQLGWRLRLWLLGIPAGVGKATLQATLKLWCGFPPHKSGVFSAGNGPAMRSAVLGAAVDDWPSLEALVRKSTRLTHTDPKAEQGALAVALAARLAREPAIIQPSHYLEELRVRMPDTSASEFLKQIERAVDSALRGESTPSFAVSQGWSKGVSGYVYHTVPAVIHAWLRNQRDFESAVMEVIRCGGDTDTTAAVVGGIIGSAVGKSGIPPAWLAGLREWPRSVAWMENLGNCVFDALADNKPGAAPRLPVVGLLGRNALFFAVVLLHVVRRCLPPY